MGEIAPHIIHRNKKFIVLIPTDYAPTWKTGHKVSWNCSKCVHLSSSVANYQRHTKNNHNESSYEKEQETSYFEPVLHSYPFFLPFLPILFSRSRVKQVATGLNAGLSRTIRTRKVSVA